MPAQDPALLYNEVREFIEDALKSKDRTQIKFAARRAMSGFDSTNELPFMNLYIECQYALNMAKAYHLCKELMQTYDLEPGTINGAVMVFFSKFVQRTILGWNQLGLDYDPRPEAFAIAKKYAQNWRGVMPIHGFLLALFEEGQLDLVEELALQAENRDAFHATMFLMHVHLARGNYVAAYNCFCTLVGFCAERGELPSIETQEELTSLFRLLYARFGLNIRAPGEEAPEEPKSDTEKIIFINEPSRSWDDATKFGESICHLRQFIESQVFGPEPDPAREMDIDETSDAWQTHIGHLGTLEGEPEIVGADVGYDEQKGIVVNGSY